MNQTRRSPWPGLLVIGLGASIAPLDFAVNVAFPAISAAFALDVAGIRWLVICYVVTYASLMLAFGKLGDIAGHRRVFRAGLVMGVVAFVACALAPAYAWLLAARVAQGIATALVLSCAPALVVSLCGEARRTWALSRYAMIAALAGLIGPVIGGASIDLMGWQGVFWFRVPVALLTLIVLARLPDVPERPVPVRRFDRASSLLLTAGLALVLSAPALWLNAADSVWPMAAALLGGGLLAAFALRERGQAEPMLPPAVLRSRVVLLSSVGSVALNLTGFAVPLLVPFHLVRMSGFSASAMGLLLAMSTLGVLAASAAAPRLVRAFGQSHVAWLGMMVTALAQFMIALWPPIPLMPMLAAALLLHGWGVGLFQVSYTDLMIATLPRDARGVAGSLSIFTRTLGVVLAAVILSGALQAMEERHLGAGYTAAGAFHAAFSSVFLYSAWMLAGGVALAWVLPAAWRRGRMRVTPHR